MTDAPVTPFTVPMPLPPVLSPTASHDGTDFYRIAIRTADAEIIPGLKTPVITFGGGFVGPTIRAKVGRRVSVTYDNKLSEVANVHLHGGREIAAGCNAVLDIAALDDRDKPIATHLFHAAFFLLLLLAIGISVVPGNAEAR